MAPTFAAERMWRSHHAGTVHEASTTVPRSDDVPVVSNATIVGKYCNHSPAIPNHHHEVDGVLVRVDGVAVETELATMGHTFPFNLTGHPAVVIPLALSDTGLPIGVKIVGRRWGEIDLFGVARAIDSLTQGFRQPTLSSCPAIGSV